MFTKARLIVAALLALGVGAIYKTNLVGRSVDGVEAGYQNTVEWLNGLDPSAIVIGFASLLVPLAILLVVLGDN